MIDLVAEQAPLGGLERWLRDPSVNELMVNAGSEIWVERGGIVGQRRRQKRIRLDRAREAVHQVRRRGRAG